jgi:hypothetical protein
MNNFLDGITLLGIPAVVLVPFLVEGLKMLGLPAKWAGLAALAAGFAVAGMAEAVTAWPQVLPIVRFLVAGTLLGLASSGAYSQFKVIKPDRIEAAEGGQE